jgi:hypothetical protein
LVYDYHAASRTITEVHSHGSQPQNTYYKRGYNTNGSLQQGGGVEERSLWSYLIQLACGIKAVHDAGLAVRSFSIGDGSEVWVTGKNRYALSMNSLVNGTHRFVSVRIGGVGLWDVLAYDPTRQINAQQEMSFLQVRFLLLPYWQFPNTRIARGLTSIRQTDNHHRFTCTKWPSKRKRQAATGEYH